MCAGIGSPGTLREVVRGYLGDKKSEQLFRDNTIIKLFRFLKFKSSLFDFAGGNGFLRPFELATFRLQNMIEVIRNLSTYFPDHSYVTQRGATFLLHKNDLGNK